jgi:DNA-binding GntR family transcriptional regulator
MLNDRSADAKDSAAAILSRSFSYVSAENAPPSRSLLRDQVYAHIRQLIVQGVLAPEMQLRDVEIAESMGVSRTPVREAIRRLQDEGLIVAEAARWTKVAPVSTSIADEIYPMIGVLERLAVSQTGPWSKKAIAELRTANRRMSKALGKSDGVAASAADYAFHSAIVNAAGNTQLAAVLRDLKMHLHRLEALYFSGSAAADISAQEHEAVIEALADGDLDAAGIALEQNWTASLVRVHERLHQDADDKGEPLPE